jgi:WD40-like Beta Propeller Repeat
VTFSWNGEKQNNYDIYVVLTSGGPPLRLTTSAARDTAPAWSPDGRYIAFIRDPGPSGAVYLISPLGGPDRKIAETKGHSVCWTADSTSIGTSDCRSFNVKARRMLPFASWVLTCIARFLVGGEVEHIACADSGQSGPFEFLRDQEFRPLLFVGTRRRTFLWTITSRGDTTLRTARLATLRAEVWMRLGTCGVDVIVHVGRDGRRRDLRNTWVSLSSRSTQPCRSKQR